MASPRITVEKRLPSSSDVMSPVAAIKHALRIKLMEAGSISALEYESGISRPMLSMILGNSTYPGRDTLCLLLAWDAIFYEPVWRYMLDRGTQLRAAAFENIEEQELLEA